MIRCFKLACIALAVGVSACGEVTETRDELLAQGLTEDEIAILALDELKGGDVERFFPPIPDGEERGIVIKKQDKGGSATEHAIDAEGGPDPKKFTLDGPLRHNGKGERDTQDGKLKLKMQLGSDKEQDDDFKVEVTVDDQGKVEITGEVGGEEIAAQTGEIKDEGGGKYSIKFTAGDTTVTITWDTNDG